MQRIDFDSAEAFLDSIISQEPTDPDVIIENINERLESRENKQIIKTRFASQLMTTIEVFLNFIIDEPETNVDLDVETAFISSKLMNQYLDYTINLYYEFEVDKRMTTAFVMNAFNRFETQPGDINNTPLRYLEESLAEYLQEDDDFLGTFLRACQLIEKKYPKINAFSWISGEMIDENGDGQPLLYSDWKRLVLEQLDSIIDF